VEYLQDNVIATQRLLEAARNSSIKKFVYASSSSIYGDAKAFPTPESALPSPISLYGATKLAGEHLCSVYASRFRIPAVVLRYFTVFGPRQRPDMAFHIFGRAILAGQPIEVFGDGRQSREFTYAGDIVNATFRAAERGTPGRIFNIGGGHTIDLIDAIRIMESVSGEQAIIKYTEAAAGDPRRTSADISLASNELGYQPSVDIEEGLSAEIEWLRATMPATQVKAAADGEIQENVEATRPRTTAKIAALRPSPTQRQKAQAGNPSRRTSKLTYKTPLK
jgi:UDP-glucuronate 4-epimerase